MCVELEILNNDKAEFKSSNNEFHLLKQENITVNDVMKEENYIDTKSDTLNSEDIKIQDKKQYIEIETDYSHLEEIRIELEKQLGDLILSKVYKIVEESVLILY